MVTQNETYTSTVVPYSPDILDDLPIDDQLAVEFFATARCASFIIDAHFREPAKISSSQGTTSMKLCKSKLSTGRPAPICKINLGRRRAKYNVGS